MHVSPRLIRPHLRDGSAPRQGRNLFIVALALCALLATAGATLFGEREAVTRQCADVPAASCTVVP